MKRRLRRGRIAIGGVDVLREATIAGTVEHADDAVSDRRARRERIAT